MNGSRRFTRRFTWRPSGQFLLWLLLAAAIVLVAALQRQPQEMQAYDPYDNSSVGLRALVLWLEEMDYAVAIKRPGFPAGPGLLILHSGPNRVPMMDARLARSWVEDGGTLVLVGMWATEDAVIEEFGVSQEYTTGFARLLRQSLPFLPDLPVEWNPFLTSLWLDSEEAPSALPVLVNPAGEPVVMMQPIGAGVVWHLTQDVAWTNLHLRDENIAGLLPAVLRTVPPDAPVIISNYHLWEPEAAPGTPANVRDWLYSHPLGWGILAASGLLLLFLTLQGRRLGPPLPAPTAARPRAAAEYVTAIAGLQRRANQRGALAQHHRQRLKSALSRTAHLDSTLPDNTWLARLRQADILPPATLDQVATLLAGYSSNPDEAALIQLVQSTDKFLQTVPRVSTQFVR